MVKHITGKIEVDMSEVDADTIPGPRESPWQVLYREVKLRLERTPPSRALRCEFTDADTARRAHSHIRNRFSRSLGRGAVTVRRVEENGHGVLYIRQGKAYPKLKG